MSSRKNDNKPTPVLETTPPARTKKVEKIIGPTMLDGRLTFGVKYKNIKVPQLVIAEVLHIEAPQELLKYYEERLQFNDIID
ncbi:heterochromatin protein 1-like [Acyrthosiphon pisum]|uniref:Chromo shadow domain-containing protein n=1 Tax=Acyrthosiphon pisum TaxID=7029 RepID=A0A8R1W5X4_ACYPI|nr:heterochromatin protein 1-like [Acyrthosiphon pisum]|eukprot:XP_003245184.1 PREDICTED: heterochromatin protein 1-like [Acyrthosiphon pisum]